MHEFDISLLEQYGKRVHTTSATETKLWIILCAVCVAVARSVVIFIFFRLRDSSIEMFCNNVWTSDRTDDDLYICTAYLRAVFFCLTFYAADTRDRVSEQRSKRSEQNECDMKRRSDKGHVWLITLIFKLIYKRFSLWSLLLLFFFHFFALKRCVTRYFQLTSETSYSLSDRFAWAQIRKWVSVAHSTIYFEKKNEFIAKDVNFRLVALSLSLAITPNLDKNWAIN